MSPGVLAARANRRQHGKHRLSVGVVPGAGAWTGRSCRLVGFSVRAIQAARGAPKRLASMRQASPRATRSGPATQSCRQYCAPHMRSSVVSSGWWESVWIWTG